MSNAHHDRSQGDADKLKDAKAMLAAAKADAIVEKHLGAKYLEHVADDIAAGEEALANRPLVASETVADGTRLAHLAEKLADTLGILRGRVKITPELAGDAKDFGEGVQFDPKRPEDLVVKAHSMQNAFTKHKGAAKTAHVDAQLLHDLKTTATELGSAHTHHTALRKNRHDTTLAANATFAALGADAAHIRLVGNVLHHGDDTAMSHYESPIAAHVVVPRTKPAPTTP